MDTENDNWDNDTLIFFIAAFMIFLLLLFIINPNSCSVLQNPSQAPPTDVSKCRPIPGTTKSEPHLQGAV